MTDDSVGLDSLVYHLTQEVLISADSSVQLVISLLHRLGLRETLPRKGTGEKRNGNVDSQNSLRISLGSYDSWRGPYGEAVPNCPVLDGLHESLLFRLRESRWVLLPGESRHGFAIVAFVVNEVSLTALSKLRDINNAKPISFVSAEKSSAGEEP